jgi:hypothetical protein
MQNGFQLIRSKFFLRSEEQMDKYQQYKTMIINVALTSWIEAIAIAKEFNIDFTSKYHRRFLKDILGLYSVNDLEQI